MRTLFVYGTLRPGQYNDSISSLATQVIDNVTALGTMYNRHGSEPFYPVVDFDLTATTVVGALMIFNDDDPQVAACLSGIDTMEEGAGYHVRRIPITMGDDDEVWADAYHFSVKRHYVGVKIPHGDWLRFVAEFSEPEDDWLEGAHEDSVNGGGET